MAEPATKARITRPSSQYALAMAELTTKAQITCPECGYSRIETMPTDACQHFYRCQGCGELLRPRPGDCCVFCSYADSICPPKQMTG